MAAIELTTATRNQCYFLNLTSNLLTLEGYVNNFPLKMLVDTGSSLSLVNKTTFDKLKIKQLSSSSMPTLRQEKGLLWRL